jgi:pimeloyl-ACP methyl ester carboxylesterase
MIYNEHTMSFLRIHNRNIFYSEKGRGKTIVLLHGFTESSRIWNGFAAKFSKKYRVIAIDLPGHGKSDCFAGIHTMELMADLVYKVLKKLRVGKCLMAGHSMGGYVTLEFASKHPGMLKGFCLFHSHCFPDSETERENRDRTIAVVNQDKFSYVAQFIPSLFPVEVHRKFSKEIEKLIRRAAKMPKDGVVAALEGMKIRADHSGLLRNTSLPVFFILGLKDTRVPAARIWDMISLPAVSGSLLLRECGHMGYIEMPDQCFEALSLFAKKVF